MSLRAIQGLALGLGRVAASAAPALDGTLQLAALLQDPVITSTQEGLVTAFTVAGQSVMASDQGFPWQMCATDALVEGHRSMAVPMDQNQVVAMTLALAGAGTTAASIAVDPIDRSQVIPINDLGRALDYAFGLGLNVVGAGLDSVAFSATSRRDVILGRFILRPNLTPEDLTVRSILVNNKEMLAGAAGAIDEVPIDAFSHLCSDIDGTVLGYPVNQNGNVTCIVHNYNVAGRDVRGGFFVLHPAAAQ